jgi:hypothetical protein
MKGKSKTKRAARTKSRDSLFFKTSTGVNYVYFVRTWINREAQQCIYQKFAAREDIKKLIYTLKSWVPKPDYCFAVYRELIYEWKGELHVNVYMDICPPYEYNKKLNFRFLEEGTKLPFLE